MHHVTALVLVVLVPLSAAGAAEQRPMKPMAVHLQRPAAPARPIVRSTAHRLDAPAIKARMTLRSKRSTIALVEDIRKLALQQPQPTSVLRLRMSKLLAGKNDAEQMAIIKAIANWERPSTETVRNKRAEFQTMFENFDDRSDDLFNILGTVLKNMKEMQGSVGRSML